MFATLSRSIRHGVPTRTNPDASRLNTCAGAVSVVPAIASLITPSSRCHRASVYRPRHGRKARLSAQRYGQRPWSTMAVSDKDRLLGLSPATGIGPSLGREPGVHHEGMAGHETGVVARQKEHGVGNLVGSALATHRHHGIDPG